MTAITGWELAFTIVLACWASADITRAVILMMLERQIKGLVVGPKHR